MENLTYLTALLPAGTSVAYELAKRLNKKKLKPLRKEFYPESTVNNVIYGKTNDEKVKEELILWLREIYTPEELEAKIEAWKNRGALMAAELL